MKPIRTKMLSDQGFSNVSVPKSHLEACLKQKVTPYPTEGENVMQ